MFGSGDDKVIKRLESESETEDGLDDEITDAMLGGLRRGILSIRNNAKDTLEKCTTGETRTKMEHLLKSETIKLLRSEKSFLNTARIVAGIVDEISSDFEGDDEDEENKAAADTPEILPIQNDSNQNSLEVQSTSRRISVFRPKLSNIDSIIDTAKLMGEMFTDRMKSYEDSLTDVMLEDHPKFKALQKQINLAEASVKEDEGTLMMVTQFGQELDKIRAALYTMKPPEENETELSDSEKANIAMLVEFGDEFDSIMKAAWKPNVIYPSEEYDVDYSVLPSVDPISRKPIIRALKNKFCNHIFEETSIRGFMAEDPEARCPMYGCTNRRRLDPEHLVFDPILNNHIKEKHYRF